MAAPGEMLQRLGETPPGDEIPEVSAEAASLTELLSMLRDNLGLGTIGLLGSCFSVGPTARTACRAVRLITRESARRARGVTP